MYIFVCSHEISLRIFLFAAAADKMSVKLDFKLGGGVGAPPWKRELMLRRNALAKTVEKNLIDKLESSKRCSQLLRPIKNRRMIAMSSSKQDRAR